MGELKRIPTGYQVEWPTLGIIIKASRVREANESITAELEVRNSSTDKPHLVEGRLNLLAPRSRSDWANDLEAIHPLGEPAAWRTLLEECARKIIRAHREGAPIHSLSGDSNAKPPSWTLKPLIRKNMVNAIFGDGNAGKSLIALAACLTTQELWTDNPMGWEVVEKTPWLYLDWEDSKEDTEWRWRCLFRGAGLEPEVLCYRHCDRPLSQELDGVLAAIENTKAEAVVIDSLGMAAGGDLNATEPALAYFQALRSLKTMDGLPVTVLQVAHNSKDPLAKHKSIYGNYYYTTQTRNIWEMRSTQGTDQDSKIITFKDNKWNTRRKLSDFAILMRWNELDGITSFSPTPVPPDLSDDLPMQLQIRNILLRKPLSVKDLTIEMGLPPSKEPQVRTRLNEFSGKLFTKIGDLWAVLSPYENSVNSIP